LLIIILIKNNNPKISIKVPTNLLIGKKKFIINVMKLKKITPNIGNSDIFSLEAFLLKKIIESNVPKENIMELVKIILNKSVIIYHGIKIKFII
tara:strand:+ start:147 stop:428 length:282 start_codon:yes stop_codon:yes gene_type:complete